MFLTDIPPPRVMIIGHGFMGENHQKKLKLSKQMERRGWSALLTVIAQD